MSWAQLPLYGRVGHDVELVRTPSGRAVVNLTCYHNESWKDSAGEQQSHSSNFQVRIWGAQAEWAAKNLKKGKMALFVGNPRLEMRVRKDLRKVDPDDNTKVLDEQVQIPTFVLIANTVTCELPPRPKAASSANQRPTADEEAAAAELATAASPAASGEVDEDDPDNFMS